MALQSMAAREPTALLVDDDFMFAMHASVLLSDAGYRPMEVPNADQAIALLDAEDGKIDLLFTDVRLPGMDGYELARTVHRRWPDISILIASGQAHPKPGIMPDNATFFPKPLDDEALRAFLKRAR